MSAADPDLAEAPDRPPMVRVRLALGWCVTHLGDDDLDVLLDVMAGWVRGRHDYNELADHLEHVVARGGVL